MVTSISSINSDWIADRGSPTGEALREAVTAVRAGRWIDGDPKTDGFQPPAPAPKLDDDWAPQAGRVVTRFERAAQDLDALVAEWERVAVEKLTKQQRSRMDEAIAKLDERLQKLKARRG